MLSKDQQTTSFGSVLVSHQPTNDFLFFFIQTVITRGPLDVQRSLTLASFGFFFHGPAGHVIYDNLDHLIVGTGPKQIAAKIFVDQVLWWYVRNS